MARQFNGTSDYLTSASALNCSSFHALTISFWAWIDSYANADAEFFQFGTGGAGTVLLRPDASIHPAGRNVWYTEIVTAGGTAGVYFDRPSAAAWHHFLIQLNLNGASFSILHILIDHADVTNVGVTGTDSTATFLPNGTPCVMSANGTQFFAPGRFEQLGLWAANVAGANTILSSADEAAVYNGTPLSASVAPLYYWPITGSQSPEPATVGSVALNVVGTTHVAGHAGGTIGSLQRRTFMSGGFQELGGGLS